MRLTVKHKFLKIPVDCACPAKKYRFFDGDKLVYDLDIKSAGADSPLTAFVDLSRFAGKTLTVTAGGEDDFVFGESDSYDLPGLREEPYRPLVHYTVPFGHNNDPNGLVFRDGVWHLFCQYNPCAAEWGNMHWFHAVSRDLVNWDDVGIALFPDETGVMYSGSAFIDEKNVSGLGKAGRPATLFFYTAAAGRTELAPVRNAEQCLAYSFDGSELIKYPKNPIIPHLDAYNRDPKVVRCEEMGKYLLIFYRVDSRYVIEESDDLVHWKFLQEITIDGDSECPDLYPLYHKGKKYWVISGASDRYVIGHFEKTGFVRDLPEKSLSYAKTSYAAQSYSGLPEGRVVRFAWGHLKLKGVRISSQMSVPQEMSLEEAGGSLWLAANPVREFESLRETDKGTSFRGIRESVRVEPESRAFEVIFSSGTPDAKTVLDVCGAKIVADASAGVMKAIGQNGKEYVVPLSVEEGKTDLRVIADSSSIEIFADGGKILLTVPFPCHENAPYVSVETETCDDDAFLTVYPLKKATIKTK